MPPRDRSGKVLSLRELLERRAAARASGRSVVQCHGCFDIVHPGHVRHLQQAARHGDVLLVSITADREIAKGTGRPLIPQELRAENLAALDCVDWVVIHDGSTAVELLEAVRPDVYIKGREYESNKDPRFGAERSAVETHGGRVVFSSGDVVFSSTALIAELEDRVDPMHARLRQLVERFEVTADSIDRLVHDFRGRRVCVIGECVRDTYFFCDRPDVAGESPVMTLRPMERRAYDGGAAMVARHVAAMGGRAELVTAMPGGPEGAAMRERLFLEGVRTKWIETDRAMHEKQRFLVGQQKVVKVDLGEPIELDAARRDQLVEVATEAAEGCDAAILVDYGLGLLTASLTGRLCAALRPRVGVLAGDVSGRRSNLLEMKGVDLVCPNEGELRDAMRDYAGGLSAVVYRLLDRIGAKSALVTLGPEGLIAFEPREGAEANPGQWTSSLSAEHVPSLANFAVDQLGCGDALLSATTLAMACGAPLPVASMLGATAAAVEAQRLGNAVIGAEDLRRGAQRLIGARLAFDREAHTRLVG